MSGRGAFRPNLAPVELTLQLATVTTLALLVIATPLAWWLARSKAKWEEGVAAIVSLPLVLPPTVLGFYLLIAIGPDGPGGGIASLWGARTLAFTFTGLVIGSVVSALPTVVQPIRNAFPASAIVRSKRPRRCALRLAGVLARRAAAREPWFSLGDGARVLPYRRQVRRCADDWRQHPRPHPRHVDGDL